MKWGMEFKSRHARKLDGGLTDVGMNDSLEFLAHILVRMELARLEVNFFDICCNKTIILRDS
jgi:hypothetical protein